MDENIPKEAVVFMENKLHWDVRYVPWNKELQEKEDLYHYRKARKEKRILLTRDKDYLDPCWFPFHRSMGIIVVEEKNTKRLIHILQLLSKFFDELWEKNLPYLSSLKIKASLSGVKVSYQKDREGIEEKFYPWPNSHLP